MTDEFSKHAAMSKQNQLRLKKEAKSYNAILADYLLELFCDFQGTIRAVVVNDDHFIILAAGERLRGVQALL